MKTLFNLFVIFSLLFITGCQPDAISTEDTATPSLDILPTSTGSISPSQPSEYTEGIDMSDLTKNPNSNAAKMVQLSKESLARKFKISQDQIHLFSVAAIIWPDASLGCPQPEILYAQVLTPGFQILLEAMGQTFSYHTDDIDRIILCHKRPPDEIFLPP